MVIHSFAPSRGHHSARRAETVQHVTAEVRLVLAARLLLSKPSPNIPFDSRDLSRWQTGKRDKATIIYNTSLPVLFGVKKYADSLWKVVEDRGIIVNNRRCLTEVRPDTREAVFVNLDKPEEQFVDKVSCKTWRAGQTKREIALAMWAYSS